MLNYDAGSWKNCSTHGLEAYIEIVKKLWHFDFVV